jgi:hypothetical protein
LAMGAPHALWGRVEHTFGGTMLLNDGQSYQSALIQHFKSANTLEDNSIQTDGYWVNQRASRIQHTGLGAYAQRVPLRWQPATPFFETGQALWCGGATHEFRLTGHNAWKSRILDTGVADVLGTGVDNVRVEIYNLAFHAVFAKMDPQYGPSTLLPRHVNYSQEYANMITVPGGLVVEATTVDKTFTVQVPGSVTQIYCWLQEDARGAATRFKPLHFFDTYVAANAITSIGIEHDGVQQPTIPYIVAMNPAARMRGEEAYNDLIDALGARGSGAGAPITPGMWHGVRDIDPNGTRIHGDTTTGSWNLYGFRIVKPVVTTAMTNFTVSIQRAAGANLATKLYVAMVQPAEVVVTFDANLNLAAVDKVIM